MNEVESFLRSNGAKQDFAHWSGKFQDMKNLWSALMKGIPEEEDEGEEWKNEKARRWALWILSRENVLTGKDRLRLARRFAELYFHSKPLFSRHWEENCNFIKRIFQVEEFDEGKMKKCIFHAYTDYINTVAESAGIPYYVLRSYFDPESLIEVAGCCLNAAYEYVLNESDDPLIAECLRRFNTNAAGNAWHEEQIRQFQIIQTMDNPFKQSEGEEK